MGFKGYRLWAMGQLDSTCTAPPLRHLLGGLRARSLQRSLDVAVQIEFESKF
jgi:hypothetical protein